MDTIQIGKFIAQLRKRESLTQEALGEKLGVTNKTAPLLAAAAYAYQNNKMMAYVEGKLYDE